jgi:hypothetical protein
MEYSSIGLMAVGKHQVKVNDLSYSTHKSYSLSLRRKCRPILLAAGGLSRVGNQLSENLAEEGCVGKSLSEG